MIHYSCDLCKRPLDPEDDLRYIVKVEVYAAFDPMTMDERDDDSDGLQDLHEILEQIDDVPGEEAAEEVYQKLQFDLCPECRKKFVKNPLGRKASEQFDFSKN